MAGNRVDELEAKVQELEATVDGLTDELVETKERLHALEDDADESYDILETGSTDEATGDATDAADAAGAADADGVNPDEAEEEDNSGSGDDIIVA
ncbi:hypothetical protein BRD02_00750 [Halobacteriales archaeon QS_8_69_73]|nr:MAG: hypothetical protein BRD02_00750 [Halobacteriales archaeon QS_8_69_73]